MIYVRCSNILIQAGHHHYSIIFQKSVIYDNRMHQESSNFLEQMGKDFQKPQKRLSHEMNSATERMYFFSLKSHAHTFTMKQLKDLSEFPLQMSGIYYSQKYTPALNFFVCLLRANFSNWCSCSNLWTNYRNVSIWNVLSTKNIFV